MLENHRAIIMSYNYKYEEIFVILQSNHSYKSKETRVVTWAFNPDELGIKCPLEYLQVYR